MIRLKSLLPFVLLLIVCGALVWWLFPIVHPYGGLLLPLDRREVIEHSREFLTSSHVDLNGLYPHVSLRTDRPLVHQTQQTRGLDASNRLLRDSIPAYYWQVRWMPQEGLSFSFNDNEEDSEKRIEQAAKSIRGESTLRMDTRGRLLGFERTIPDSAPFPSMTMGDAKALALNVLRTVTPFFQMIADTSEVESERVVQQSHRRDYQFVWRATSPVLHNTIHLKVTIAGSVLGKLEAVTDIPDAYKKADTLQIVYILLILLYALLAVGMVVAAYRRIRSFEIGFRAAIFVGIITGLLFDLELYLGINEAFRWEFLLPLIFTPLFVGGAMVLVWAVAESVVRELWREKFISIDLLSNGHVFHSRIGQNTIRGMAVGTTALGLWLVLTHLAGRFTPMWLTHAEHESISTFTVSLAAPYVLGQSFSGIIFQFAVFVLFGLTVLRRWITSAPLLVATGAVIMAVLNAGHLAPLPVEIAIQTLVYALFLWSFYRYDALTTLTAFVTWNALQETGALLVCGNPAYISAGAGVLGFLAALFMLSAAVQFRKEEIADFDAIAPAFVRHITERQRLQQELEIAREVQMSFLPKNNPVRYRLDIAARCAPAQEVGGDYYDFIELSDSRLGVAIGDVSGKGTQAAFFMTLAKGFLRALATMSESPSAVLAQANRLFYESVDRGVFISMVYGIFDTTARTLTLARAGHNPVIVRKSQATEVQVLHPTGLALGLDGGTAFGKSIEDIRVDFQPGDVFVLYTDGFSEAMNKKLEEFGEERLGATVQTLAGGSAAEIMEGMFRTIEAFAGGAQQHDDMSIVVIKII